MYHPTGRVLTVLELLQSRPSITGRELADRLECDLRSVRRYVAKLQDVGIPVESMPGPSGRYTLRPGFRLPPLIFTEAEAAAVVLGLVGTPWLRISLPSASVESALSKIGRVLPTTTRDQVETLSRLLVMPPDAGLALDVALLLRLSQASKAGHCLELDYRSRETTHRVVEPYGVTGYEGRWYLVGYCRLRGDVRVFRLDRIVAATVLDQAFDRPSDFDLAAYIEEGLASQRWKVRLRFWAPQAEVRQALGRQGSVTATEIGCDYEVPASDLDLLARQLLLTRLAFEVVDPPELRQALEAVGAEALTRGTGQTQTGSR